MIEQVVKGEVELVFISPENIVTNPMFRNMLLTKPYKERMVALVADEAHCVKTWLVVTHALISKLSNKPS